MTLNGVMAVTLRYFTEFGKPALQKTICGGIYARLKQESIVFLVRVQCRRKESSLSLSYLLMSFLYFFITVNIYATKHAKRVLQIEDKTFFVVK